VTSCDSPSDIVDSIGMTLKLVPAGEFQMGSPNCDPDAPSDETPQHRVRITKSFYLGMCPVTLGQFRRFVEAAGYRTEAEQDGEGGWGLDVAFGKWTQSLKYTWRTPGFDQTDEHPVVTVSWNDANAICAWLSQQEGQTYRLPTEAEWEYACRAGSETRYCFGDDPKRLPSFAWFAENSGRDVWNSRRVLADSRRDPARYPAEVARQCCRSQQVGEKRPNAFGLHDMHGNVWEWCGDWYDAVYYRQSPTGDPRGPDRGAGRALQGGGWYFDSRFARSASRSRGAPEYRISVLGFGVARLPSSQSAPPVEPVV
jgi:formylglycine-generating enzyme required for sulfatase activity